MDISTLKTPYYNGISTISTIELKKNLEGGYTP